VAQGSQGGFGLCREWTGLRPPRNSLNGSSRVSQAWAAPQAWRGGPSSRWSNPLPQKCRRGPPPPLPAADFLRLDEEREIAVLLRRLAALGPILTSDERVSLEARLRVGLLPIGRISRIRRGLERVAARGGRGGGQK